MAVDWFQLSDDLAEEVKRLGFEWIDFTHTSSFRAPWLRLYVDRRNAALTIDDITYLTRMLVNWLRTQLPETMDFRLDVSSPGLDRPFNKPWQFEKHIGQHLHVKIPSALNALEGRLESASETGIQITTPEGEKLELNWDGIIEAKVIFPVQEKKMKTKGNKR